MNRHLALFLLLCACHKEAPTLIRPWSGESVIEGAKLEIMLKTNECETVEAQDTDTEAPEPESVFGGEILVDATRIAAENITCTDGLVTASSEPLTTVGNHALYIYFPDAKKREIELIQRSFTVIAAPSTPADDPADDTDPADPAAPADPADPTDPADPADPTDPTDPADPPPDDTDTTP
jgi:hypothetical protein